MAVCFERLLVLESKMDTGMAVTVVASRVSGEINVIEC
jgi:hypothetical protein